ncbi:MAG TPA: hypothetical protein DC047_11450 [Blastocatellia bacterium]|nr:hypothetical protein [Blastocatellia bacterium]
MSDKDRKKKDGQDKGKKNERMRESVNERQSKPMTERERQKHEAKMTNSIPEGAARLKKKKVRSAEY